MSKTKQVTLEINFLRTRSTEIVHQVHQRQHAERSICETETLTTCIFSLHE